MRHRDILLLGTGLTGAFFLGLGMLVVDAPVSEAPASAIAESRPAALAAGEFGWIPAQVPAELGQPIDESEADAAAPPGEAGVWSIPAEFAEPE